jgi:hypothetical protein
MVLAIQASNVSMTNHAGCQLPNPDVIHQLNNLALIPVDEASPGPLKTIIDFLPQDSANDKQ